MILQSARTESPACDDAVVNSTRRAFFSGWTPLVLLLLHAMLFFLYPPFGDSGNDYAFFLISGFDYCIVNSLIIISITAALIQQARMA